MRQLHKRLIMTDFDDTLTSKNEVSLRNKKAIAEYVSAGGIFVVCTGRMLCSILPRVRELGLKGLVAAYQGSVIADIESGTLLKKHSLSSNDCAEICRFAEGCGFAANAYCDEVLYTGRPCGDRLIENYEKVTGVTAVKVGFAVSKYITENSLNCHKITFLVYPEQREKLFNLLQEKFCGRFDITCSASILVEVSPLGDNKGEALKFIADYFKIDATSTVAVGDNLNDLAMLQVASIGVAVGNAVAELKEKADYVAPANSDDGVAHVIEKFGFSPCR